MLLLCHPFRKYFTLRYITHFLDGELILGKPYKRDRSKKKKYVCTLKYRDYLKSKGHTIYRFSLQIRYITNRC